MEASKYYQSNQIKIIALTDNDWKVALWKCKEHIRLRLKQRTLSGAHSASNLGAEPVDHYLGIAYEKILTGAWDWKDDHTLGQQLIRIADSYMSKSVEKAGSAKESELQIVYKDVQEEFYDLAAPPSDDKEQKDIDQQLKKIENAAAGDENLEFMIEGLKEGKKRVEIADLLGIGVRQLDKLREKLIKRIQNQQSSTQG